MSTVKNPTDTTNKERKTYDLITKCRNCGHRQITTIPYGTPFLDYWAMFGATPLQEKIHTCNKCGTLSLERSA